MKKRSTALILIAMLLFSLLPVSVFAADSNVPEGYIEIEDAMDLYFIRNDLSGKFMLTADIDLTDALSEHGDLYNEAGWIAIGYDSNSSQSFTGVIDGNGHTISGLVSDGPGAGLVCSNAGTIRDLTVASGSVSSDAQYVGAICGTNTGVISGCVNFASVTVTNGKACAGGIAGMNNGSSALIEKCGNYGNVSVVSTAESGAVYVGGIAGSCNGSNIFQCYNAGNVSAATGARAFANAGGVAGYCTGSVISNCYNTGSVSAKSVSGASYSYNGGIVGYGVNATVSCCYNTGSVENEICSINYGGIAGYMNTNKMISCYYLNTVDRGTYPTSNDKAISCLSAAMKDKRNYSGFDFENVWVCLKGECPIQAFRHTHGESELVGVVKESCTKNGYSGDYVCVDCGNVLTAGTVVPATGHDWDDGVVTQEPTTEAAGIRTFTCSVCSSTKTETIPALHKHSYTPEVTLPACTEDGFTTYTCACGHSFIDDPVPATGHSFTYVVSTEPTEETEGKLTGICANCTETDVKSIPVLSDEYYDYEVVTESSCSVPGVGKYTLKDAQYGEQSITVDIPVTEHSFVYGKCIDCGARDPEYVSPFADITDETSFYYDAVLWAYYRTPDQITAGSDYNEDGELVFNADGLCSRGQVVTFLWRAAGCPEPILKVCPFKDVVNEGECGYYYKAILWAYERGIAKGFTEDTFCPFDPVTRAQFVTFLYRFVDEPEATGDLSFFSDWEDVEDCFTDSMSWAVVNGIILGYDGITLRPNETCFRWTVVTILSRVMDEIPS